jgi:RNA polymerase sigma-70 factor (ECF subfamily)
MASKLRRVSATAIWPFEGDRMSTVLDVSSHHDALSAFLHVRARLFTIAYRMLRSAAEAEDVVQDVWVRWQTADRQPVRDAAAFLATTTRRLAINVLQSARTRRETCVEPWSAEPIDPRVDPGTALERSEALAQGVQVLLETLSPMERDAYILREAFGHAYRDIARVLGLREANARQIVTRARHRVVSGRRAPVSPAEHRRLLDAFVAAAEQANVTNGRACWSSSMTTLHSITSTLKGERS